MADDPYVLVDHDLERRFTTLTLNRPQRRNPLSSAMLAALEDALAAVARSDALGVILAGAGPVFSAGHDMAEMAGSDLPFMDDLLRSCVRVMDAMQALPQPVVARVHGLATAAGCQLVAAADLAVAADTAGFAIPGGKGGWFCHTPLVALTRNVGRKRALEMAFSGDVVDAATALDWGLVNAVVPGDDLEAATLGLLERCTRGSRESKAMGKRAFYAQVDLDQPKAYAHAQAVMAAASQRPDAQEGMAAFAEKRHPRFAP